MKKHMFLAKYGSATHLHHLIDHIDKNVQAKGRIENNLSLYHVPAMMRNKTFNDTHHERLQAIYMNHDISDKETRDNFLLLSPHTPSKVFDDELANPNGSLRLKLDSLASRKASMDGFRSAMKDPDFRVRSVAALHHQDGSLLNAVIHDPEPYVRRQVFYHTKRTKEHLQHLITDPDKGISDDAKSDLQFWENMTK